MARYLIRRLNYWPQVYRSFFWTILKLYLIIYFLNKEKIEVKLLKLKKYTFYVNASLTNMRLARAQVYLYLNIVSIKLKKTQERDISIQNVKFLRCVFNIKL